MLKKKMKLDLEDLKVQSFVTTLNDEEQAGHVGGVSVVILGNGDGNAIPLCGAGGSGGTAAGCQTNGATCFAWPCVSNGHGC